jgi:hypothetical protein
MDHTKATTYTTNTDKGNAEYINHVIKKKNP